MPSKLVNQAKMTISSSGTGTLTLGVAVSPYNTFATAGVNDGDIVAYSIIDGITASEKGWGIYSGLTLTRNVITSTNGNSPIDVANGAHCFIDPSSWDLVHLNVSAHALAGGL